MSDIRNYWIEHHFASQDPRHPEYSGLDGIHFDTGEESVDKILFEELLCFLMALITERSPLSFFTRESTTDVSLIYSLNDFIRKCLLHILDV